MVQSAAASVEAYLEELPEERRAVIAAVRDVVRRRLPKGYRESVAHGMIAWCVPLDRYPETYNGEPLAFAALAAQKNSCSLYLMGCYMDPKAAQALQAAARKAGKKLDMGKSCLRFRRAEDLPLEAIGDLVASYSVDDFIALYEKARGG